MRWSPEAAAASDSPRSSPAIRAVPNRPGRVEVGVDAMSARPESLDPARPCGGRHGWQWDLEACDDPGVWRQAVEACTHCPVLAGCRGLLASSYPDWSRDQRGGRNPHAVVWAGLIFGFDGKVVTARGLSKVASRRRRLREATERRRRAAAQSEHSPAGCSPEGAEPVSV